MKYNNNWIMIAEGLVFIAVLYLFAYTVNNNADIKTIALPDDIKIRMDREFISTNNEFVYCLEAVAVGDTLQITKAYKTETKDNTEITINYKECDRMMNKLTFKLSTYYGTIHSHPSGACVFSPLDYYTMGYGNQDFIGVICGTDHITFIYKSDVTKLING